MQSPLQERIQLLLREGRFNELGEALREKLRLGPRDVEALNLLGWACAQQGQLDEAVAHFRAAVHLKPDAAGVLSNLGSILIEQRQLSQAIPYLENAVRHQPGFVAAQLNLGWAWALLSHFDRAEPCLRAVQRLDPGNFLGLHHLGYTLLGRGQLDEAEAHLLTVVRQQPGAAMGHNTLGLLREAQHRTDEARACFDLALQLDPKFAEAWNNLGNLHAAIAGDNEQALRCFDKALELRPQFAPARYHRAMVRLAQGDFANGWPEYEFRPTVREKQIPRYARPRWTGEPLEGKTILVHAEQGLGDTLHFIRYARRLTAHGATVLCEVQRPLLPLLKRTPGIDRLILAGDELPPHDFQIPLLSVPGVVGTVDGDVPYLAADPERIRRWQEPIHKLQGRKVGIAWQGDPKYKYDWLRSIPLEQFEPLARVAGVVLVSLQHTVGLEQMETCWERVPLVSLGPELDRAGGAFMDTAAVMQHLDLVITSDSALAHLAGGLGVPVWMATTWAPDWRWLRGRADSPWYPTMRLFRQRTPGRWEAVFESMAQELTANPLPSPPYSGERGRG